jgi:transposase
LEVEVRRVYCRRCGKVKREQLDFLADNPSYTKRFAYYVGRRCRSATVKDIAEELHLDWETVKELDKQYMRAQLARTPTPGPKVIGIDEISIRKGHDYRIVVSDLLRGRAIWFGGQDRKQASMKQFYDWLGEKRAKRIRLAVMDMWKAFYNATKQGALNAAIMTSSTLCATSARRSMRCARPSTLGLKVGTASSSRVRSTRCCRAGRTCR